MENKINEILANTNEKKHLLRCLESELDNTEFLNEIVSYAEKLASEQKSDTEICNILTNYVYENMPDETKHKLNEEIDNVLETLVLPRLNHEN